LLLKLNGTLVGIDAPEDVNYIASFLRDAVTIVVAARYREKRIILPMFFGLLGAKKIPTLSLALVLSHPGNRQVFCSLRCTRSPKFAPLTLRKLQRYPPDVICNLPKNGVHPTLMHLEEKYVKKNDILQKEVKDFGIFCGL